MGRAIVNALPRQKKYILTMDRTVWDVYRLRWQIEVTFRALKSVGFNIEDSHLSTDGHFQNMLRLVFIAFAAAFIDRLIRVKSAPIPIMNKSGRKRFSIFTWGLEEVLRLLWANVKIPVLSSP